MGTSATEFARQAEKPWSSVGRYDLPRPDWTTMFLGPQYDLIWSAGALVAVALTLAALVVWFRTRWERAWEAVLTLLVIVAVPILGPAAFLASRGRRPVPVKVRSADRQS